METIKKLDESGRTLYVQIFNGKEYRLYDGERYFSRGTKRLHREVWKFYNGDIPKGYHVHHKDENTWNNEIGNLELVEGHSHVKMHTDEQIKEKGIDDFKKRMDYARIFANKWHGTDEGKKWHSEHAKKQRENMQPEVYTCLWCGKEFRSYPLGNHKFCSNKCKTAYRYHSGIDNETRKCKWCGKEFVANKYSSTEFCCRSCSGKHAASIRNKKDRDSR